MSLDRDVQIDSFLRRLSLIDERYEFALHLLDNNPSQTNMAWARNILNDLVDESASVHKQIQDSGLIPLTGDNQDHLFPSDDNPDPQAG